MVKTTIIQYDDAIPNDQEQKFYKMTGVLHKEQIPCRCRDGRNICWCNGKICIDCNHYLHTDK